MKLKAERDAFKTVKQESIAAHKEKLSVSFNTDIDCTSILASAICISHHIHASIPEGIA